VIRGTSRRRLRIRRKRKDGSSSSKELIGPKRQDVADDSQSAVREAAEEVVFETGCCLFEAVLSAIALFALLSVPAYLLLHKVT
jgi:hypothetical protein